MFLFIFESIGTSELLLIGIIALVVFGPRKLPQMAKTIGKTMADFRRTTNDFKSTWEKEVDFEEESKIIKNSFKPDEEEKTIKRNKDLNKNLIAAPEIKEIDETKFNQSIFAEPTEVKASETKPEETIIKPPRNEQSKRDWV